MFFKIAINETKYLGYFSNKIGQQELSKIVQSGQTAHNVFCLVSKPPLSLLNSFLFCLIEDCHLLGTVNGVAECLPLAPERPGSNPAIGNIYLP